MKLRCQQKLLRTLWLMVKRQSKQLVVQSEKTISSSGMTHCREDDWVIVKKQRITILIPPPLHPHEPTATCADPCANTTEDISLTTKNTRKSLLLSDPTSEVELVADGKAEHNSPHPETSSQLPKEVSLGKEKELSLHVKRIPCRRDKSVKVRATQRPLKRPRRLLIGATDFFDGGVFLDQVMRASNLDKKILRAGGLSNWLASLGLQQFVQLFDKRKVDKFQLVNLTMKKLRDMGAVAVGPRRKLMHAIDCLCQPYCFESHHLASM